MHRSMEKTLHMTMLANCLTEPDSNNSYGSIIAAVYFRRRWSHGRRPTQAPQAESV